MSEIQPHVKDSGIGNPSLVNWDYVVPENIHTPFTEGN